MSQQRSQLIDGQGRVIDYVRLSVTDRCDMRCVYCMAEKMQFMPHSELLTLEEMVLVGEALVELGVSRIRVTGGEPLVRRNLVSMLSQLSALPGLDELLITTNGASLVEQASALKAAGVNRLNISLDTLDEAQFKAITRVGKLSDVLNGIDAALAANFDRIKINAVIMRNHNEQQILPLVDYAVSKGLDISFIEEMPLGEISSHDRGATLMLSDEIQARIESRYSLQPSSYKTGGPSRYWQVEGQETRVGFISPHSNNFCSTCNRVRVTAQGRLLLCLGQENSVDLRELVRNHPGDKHVLREALQEAMLIKPKNHQFDQPDKAILIRHMSHTGG